MHSVPISLAGVPTPHVSRAVSSRSRWSPAATRKPARRPGSPVEAVRLPDVQNRPEIQVLPVVTAVPA
ncbi:MAG: hypothetical protein BRD21_05950 [Halobacteriales archaeon SW_8_66_22]|nr:MAG: hypothetical protein BRD21_05950 [Halobacteriales archaeon SW_8_66_22]